MTTELQAFGRLVEAHYRAVSAVAYAATRDLALAEDVAQDTFIAAWGARGTLREASRVRPWLCGIARNVSRNAMRKRRRETWLDSDDVVAPADASDHGVRAALDRIPPKYREALVLFYWDDQSIAGVATTLGITEQAAQKRISRARSYVAVELEDSLADVSERRRAASAVAAGVVTALGVRAHAAAPAAAKASPWLFMHAAGKAIAVASLGATAATLVVLATRAPTPAQCPPPPPVASISHEEELRLTQLRHQIQFVQFDNDQLAKADKDLEQRIADLERHRAAKKKSPPEPPAPVPSEDPKPPPPRPACDVVMCALQNWPGPCCQALEKSLPD